MLIKLPNNENIEIQDNSSALELAQKLNLTAPHQSVSVEINKKLYDLSQTLKDGDCVRFINFDAPEGKEIFWHTSAHVLAQAVLRLYPNAKPTIGPSIDNGFYYDFANLKISDSDFKNIENEMKKIISESLEPKREIIENPSEAFKDNKYKLELISGMEEGTEISTYRQGEFFDLCRGPHLNNLSKIKAFKLLKTSGAYWRGDPDNDMLTRIYGVSFPDRKELKDYLNMLEEAKKRDHKIVGPRLGIFSLHEEAPGMPLIHPKGMIVWDNLINYWKECHRKAQYVEIKTPILLTRELWEVSGHWDVYRDNMYTLLIDERDYAIKPMNCPGGMLFYKTDLHSYRELPYRVAEIGTVHRNEPSGAVSGLFRVRCFHQDDAHVFMKPNDVEEEILNVLALVDEIYTTFGLEYLLELSTRPEKDTIGSDEDWELATSSLKGALDRLGREYRINHGDGAFYGPKIDVHIKDSLGRTWQCGTIQLDLALPVRFNLEYVESDGSRRKPFIIHRTVYGSIERFLGILIEHFGGRFPLWLSPLQAQILSVADRHIDYCQEIKGFLEKSGFHCHVDDSNESVGKKIRNAQIAQANYILTIGDREMENKTINVRTREGIIHDEVNIDGFIKNIELEKNHRDLTSTYSQKG